MMIISLRIIVLYQLLFFQPSDANGTNSSTDTNNETSALRGKDISDGAYIGCFSYKKDCFKFHVEGNQTTPESCKTSCGDNGYSLAVVYNRTKCSCMCDLTCLVVKKDDNNCGLPCEGLDSAVMAVVTCGGFLAGSVYDVHNASITCTVETTSAATTSAATTSTEESFAYVIQPVHIVYFSFTGAAFAIVIIVIIFRTSKRREHNFAGTFPSHFHSNQEALTVNYSPHDTLNYPYDSLVRGIPLSHPLDPLPMATSELRSHTNRRRRRSCEDHDDDQWCDHGGRGGNGNTSSGCNFYFSTIPEDDEGREEEEDGGRGLKGMMKGKECYPTRPMSSCSSDGAYAYVDYNA